MLTIKGADGDGYREILSVAVAPVEEGATWNEVLAALLTPALHHFGRTSGVASGDQALPAEGDVAALSRVPVRVDPLPAQRR